MLSPVSPTFRSPKCRRFVVEPRPTSDVWRSIDGGAFSVQDGAAGHSPEFKPAVANVKGYKKWRLVCHYIGLSQSTGRRKFWSQTSDNTDRWKAEVGRFREEKRREEERKHYVFPMICGSGGSKSRLAKAAGVEEMRDDKLRAVVAQTTFPSQNAKNTPGSEYFWKLRCGKSARPCGAKQICKSECTKHTIVGPLLEVEMSKKCTPLWREAHFQVKMYKTHHCRTTFGSWDVEKAHALVAQSTFPSQNVQNTPLSDHFWKLRCRKSGRRCGEAHVQVKMHKAHQVRSTFGSWDVETVQAVVVRSTCPSQNV